MTIPLGSVSCAACPTKATYVRFALVPQEAHPNSVLSRARSKSHGTGQMWRLDAQRNMLTNQALGCWALPKSLAKNRPNKRQAEPRRNIDPRKKSPTASRRRILAVYNWVRPTCNSKVHNSYPRSSTKRYTRPNKNPRVADLHYSLSRSSRSRTDPSARSARDMQDRRSPIPKSRKVLVTNQRQRTCSGENPNHKTSGPCRASHFRGKPPTPKHGFRWSSTLVCRDVSNCGRRTPNGLESSTDSGV